MTTKINIKKLHANAKIPTFGSEFAAGFDIYACNTEPITIPAGETVLIYTGLAMEIPAGYGGFVYARSGLATKRGLAPANKVGVIDADYRGEIMIALHNQSQEAQEVAVGERIAQMVIAPFLKVDFNQVEELTDTMRGAGGFGSTGSK